MPDEETWPQYREDGEKYCPCGYRFDFWDDGEAPNRAVLVHTESAERAIRSGAFEGLASEEIGDWLYSHRATWACPDCNRLMVWQDHGPHATYTLESGAPMGSATEGETPALPSGQTSSLARARVLAGWLLEALEDAPGSGSGEMDGGARSSTPQRPSRRTDAGILVPH